MYLSEPQTGRALPPSPVWNHHNSSGRHDLTLLRWYRYGDTIVGSIGICTTDFNKGLLGDGHDRIVSRDLADMVVDGLIRDIKAGIGRDWGWRGVWDRNYCESREPQVLSMLLELLSHQNYWDMKLAMNSNFRFMASRSIYKVKDMVNGTPHMIDIMKVNNDRYSINVCNFGFDSVVASTANRLSRKGWSNPYRWGIVKAIFCGRFNRIRVWADGEELNPDRRMLLCTLGNNDHIGGEFFCSPRARNEILQFLSLFTGQFLLNPLEQDVLHINGLDTELTGFLEELGPLAVVALFICNPVLSRE